MSKVRDDISDKFTYVIDDASIIKIANNKKKLEGEALEKVEKAIERFEDRDDVQNVWTDLDV
jgi:transcriptional/translational regulatory protein YebC/TACO1